MLEMLKWAEKTGIIWLSMRFIQLIRLWFLPRGKFRSAWIVIWFHWINAKHVSILFYFMFWIAQHLFESIAFELFPNIRFPSLYDCSENADHFVSQYALKHSDNFIQYVLCCCSRNAFSYGWAKRKEEMMVMILIDQQSNSTNCKTNRMDKVHWMKTVLGFLRMLNYFFLQNNKDCYAFDFYRAHNSVTFIWKCLLVSIENSLRPEHRRINI